MRNLLGRLWGRVLRRPPARAAIKPGSIWEYPASITPNEVLLVGGGFLAITLLVIGLDRLLDFSTAAVWLFLPLVLLVSLRWGPIFGLLSPCYPS